MAFNGWKTRAIWVGSAMFLFLQMLLAGCTQQTSPRGQQLLTQAKQALDTAKTTHGQFNLTIAKGKANTEVWSEASSKSRMIVTQSSLSSFLTGAITVNDGKQVWAYHPDKKVVNISPALYRPQDPNAESTTGGIVTPLDVIRPVFTANATDLASAPTTIDGHSVYDVHVVSPPGEESYVGEVYIDKTTGLPVQVNLNLQGDRRVILDIPMLTLNQPLPANTFVFTPPAGVKVIRL